RKRTKKRTVKVGNTKKRVTVANKQFQDLPPYGRDILDVVFLNYDAFSTPGRWTTNRKGERVRSRSRGGRYDMKRAIQLWQPQMIILDESHRIKSPSAKKSTAIHSLG